MNSTKCIRSPLPDIIPVTGMTVPEFIRASSGKQNENTVVYECAHSGLKLTRKDILDMSLGLAAGLIKLGLKRNDVASIVLPNVPQYASIILGILDAGGIVSPINPVYTKDEMRGQLEDCEAKFVFTIPAFVPALLGIQLGCPALSQLKIIVLGETAEDSCLKFSELIKTETKGIRFLTGADLSAQNEVALLPYSSGTSGRPKGVMLTHSNVCTNILQLMAPGVLLMRRAEAGLVEPERLIGVLPFFHMFGMIVFCFAGFCYGSHTVTISKFDPTLFLGVIRAHKPTVLHVVPPLMAMLVNSPSVTPDDLKSVHTVLGGAAPFGPALIQGLKMKAGKEIHFQEGYGMTEVSACCNMLNPTVTPDKLGSCGFLLPSTMGKIVSPSGDLLGPNERGELWIKGPQVMKGYFKNPEATRYTLDSDGWLQTGDISYYDADSCFYTVDRLKELIKVKGFQVAPSELEDVLRQHPLILDAAVIGVADEVAGEAPRAYIVRKSQELTAAQAADYVKGKVAPFKELRGGLVFVESIPKAASGKILRRILRDNYDKERMDEKNDPAPISLSNGNHANGNVVEN